MEEVSKEVKNFLEKCEELKKCKFIMAPTKIKDLLKAIVGSRTLYDLFSSVSSGFDYLAAKSRCLVDLSGGYSGRGAVVLPSAARDKLAFIFCLLVEIDRDSINFNRFLQKYFSDDGSFYASYCAFCEQLIEPLESVIRSVFKKELDDGEADLLPPDVQSEDVGGLNENQNVPSAQASGMLSVIWLLIAQEKQYILESAIPADDKETGYKMLTEIYKALKDKNFDVANSLVNGYNYYILYNNAISPGVQTLFENIESFEGAV